jgi:hypothetical protein
MNHRRLPDEGSTAGAVSSQRTSRQTTASAPADPTSSDGQLARSERDSGGDDGAVYRPRGLVTTGRKRSL